MTRKKEKNPTGIQVFNHVAFGNLRMMTDDKGQPFFVGKDVAEALGLRILDTKRCLERG